MGQASKAFTTIEPPDVMPVGALFTFIEAALAGMMQHAIAQGWPHSVDFALCFELLPAAITAVLVCICARFQWRELQP